ncbi:MAG TPA: replicative DNA helicase [Acidimicrobiales bacterium]|nr:replicative DNA helicase [Acidimicrobiales bacterium]
MVQSIDDLRRRQAARDRSGGEPPTRAAGSRVPPHNLEAERSLLGAMLLSRDAIAAAVEACGSDDFYKPAHSHIFDAVTSLFSQGEPADPVTVADELNRAGLLESCGGLPALISLQADTPATTSAGRYARIVEEHALLRRLIGVAGEIAELGYSTPDDVEAVVDEAEAMVFEVAERRTTDTLKPLNRLLEDSLDRLEALYARGESVTGTPTGYVDIDERLSGLQKSALIIVGARPAMGKCVAHDTRVLDPVTGALVTVAELYRRHAEGGAGATVLSMGDDRRLTASPVGAFVDDGVKPVFKVRTRLGRQVRTTASHPFLTPQGWRPLADIAVGTRIAVPRVLPVQATGTIDDAELRLLAYLLGDGTCVGTTPRFTTASPAILAELTQAAGALGAAVVPATAATRIAAGAATIDYRISTPRGRPNPVTDLLRRHGLWGCRAADKQVPAALFELGLPQVATFLSRLFATDGCAWYTTAGDGYGRIAYASVSRRLVADVQHLLLRFGINARIRLRSVAYCGTRRPAWELELLTAADIDRFCTEIGIFSKEEACAHLLAAMRAKQPMGWTADTLPVETWEAITAAKGDRSWAAVSAAAGKRRGHNWHVGRRAPRRETVATLAAALGDAALAEEPRSDIYWDEIVAIVPDGDDQVYDLTVPGDHNFVADDVLVHNTAFALGIAAHAAMEARLPVLLFSLEMSHAEITQRLLVSEARVDANRIRNGKLVDADWPKISNAIGRLGDAPLFIDDNPRLTVMELRAKARRLKAKQGGLGLIIVDYLQLMSGRHNAENRQVEISEISRGLKVLARELEVPVVALSQLSRNLEMRADKRPILADLRESGSLEQDADVVMFLYRDEVYNPDSNDRGSAEVIVAKHRNGPTGKATLAFLDHYTRFANMAKM